MEHMQLYHEGDGHSGAAAAGVADRDAGEDDAFLVCTTTRVYIAWICTLLSAALS
jgi:hypothetical protein